MSDSRLETAFFPASSCSANSAAALSSRGARVLLPDDGISSKKFFFLKFERLGAQLLCAADDDRDFWKARREEPTLIVADYHIPNDDEEYLSTRLQSEPETATREVLADAAAETVESSYPTRWYINCS
ncbi:MAG: hypothetical protein ACXWJW_13855, partial [Xanthobacteraceae bacterium]